MRGVSHLLALCAERPPEARTVIGLATVLMEPPDGGKQHPIGSRPPPLGTPTPCVYPTGETASAQYMRRIGSRGSSSWITRYLIGTPSRRRPPHVAKIPLLLQNSMFSHAAVRAPLVSPASTDWCGRGAQPAGLPARDTSNGRQHPGLGPLPRQRRRGSHIKRTASTLNSSVSRRRVFVVMRSSDCIILLLRDASVQSGKSQPPLRCCETRFRIGHSRCWL